MTHEEKIKMLRSTIEQLYVNEGRSKSYIANLLEVDRRVLTGILNDEWKLVRGKVHKLTPSNQKFLNRNKAFIKSQLDNNITITDIAKELKVTRDYITKTIIPADKILTKAREDYHNRRSETSISKFNTSISDIEGEIWENILGYKNYQVSNKGRVRSNAIGDKDIWYEIQPSVNVDTGRHYIHLYKDGKRRAMSLPRIVGHSFVEGNSGERNTINHIDGDITNNEADNLEWTSQSENNKHSYRELGRVPVIAYQKNGKFKRIKYGQYEFKTIRAFAKFLDVSETQAHRYVEQGKCKLIY